MLEFVLALFQEDKAEEAAGSVPLLVAALDVLVPPLGAELDLLFPLAAVQLFVLPALDSIPLALG